MTAYLFYRNILISLIHILIKSLFFDTFASKNMAGDKYRIVEDDTN